MITGIREKVFVQEGGKVEISSPDLPIGMEVEVIILVDSDETDTTDYLLSSEANRRHLEKALKDAENTEKLVYVDVENL